MERKDPTTDSRLAKKAQARRRAARAQFANYIHELSDRHRARGDAPPSDPSIEASPAGD